MATATVTESAPAGERAAFSDCRKRLVRRTGSDSSQVLRRTWQILFFALNVFVGAVFYVWVRQLETSEGGLTMARPAGVEGYLPIAGLMNLKLWIASGRLPRVHPAAMFLFLAISAIALVFRKAFCSWLCPVGTVSEWLWRLGRKLLGRNLRLPVWIDLPLRSIKYLLLAFFSWAVYTMPAAAIDEFMRTPYGLIVDVKMLNFFRYLSGTAAAILLLLAIASVLVKNFWCRYLCPYGALLGLVSLLSPARIRRDEQSCIDCGKCARVCPSGLPVAKLVTIRSAECTGCLECTADCPAQGALAMTFGTAKLRREIRPWAIAAGIAVLFVGTIAWVKATGNWNSPIGNEQYREVLLHAEEALHPAP